MSTKHFLLISRAAGPIPTNAWKLMGSIKSLRKSGLAPEIRARLWLRSEVNF